MSKSISSDWKNLRDYALSINDLNYASFVGQWGLEYYVQRLKNIGFTDFDKVLDVGCGHGLWSIALSALNKRVYSIDIHQDRVNICNKLKKDFWIDNIYPSVGSATDINYPDNTFDALFCYGVFMFVDPDEAINEFLRVLKPGGKLYVCLNGPGWWLKLALKNLFCNPGLTFTALKSLFLSNNIHKPTSFTQNSFRRFLAQRKFKDILCKPEGMTLIGINSDYVEPVYISQFVLLDYVFEATCSKPGDSSVLQNKKKTHISNHLFTLVAASLNKKFFSYNDLLYQFHADDTSDLVNSSPQRSCYSLLLSSDLFYKENLDYIVNHVILDDSDSPLQKIRKLLNFTQLHFYHHFSIQPVKDGSLIRNPLSLLDLRVARCGSQARFLADLLDIAGFESGILMTPNHIACEVFFLDQWRLLDPNLYPPGILPCDVNDIPLSTDYILQNPFVLDKFPNYISYNHFHISLFANLYPTAYSIISEFLIHPLFPSSSYFSNLDQNCNASLQISRYRKNPNTLPTCFSENRFIINESFYIQSLKKRCRSSQPLNLFFDGDFLTWSCSSGPNSTDPLYEVYISPSSRDWSYEQIPVICLYQFYSLKCTSMTTKVPISRYLSSGINFITVVSRDPSRQESFCLPSDELIVYN